MRRYLCAFSGQLHTAALCTEGGARLFPQDLLPEPEAIFLSHCDLQHLKMTFQRASPEHQKAGDQV